MAMRKSDKPGAAQRRLWRMTPEAPLGEYVDADEKSERPLPPAPDELLESSWVRSSWDLLNGLEVTESGPGDLIESYFDVLPAPTRVPVRERPRNAGEWIRRFALRLAELDRQREPKDVIELAKRQWMTTHYLLPEEAAELEHVGTTKR
jgi:hypothetical protein